MAGYLEWKRDAMIGAVPWWNIGNPDDCIAAYQFKGVSNETTALTDLTGHGYNLNKNFDPQWDSTQGYFLQNNKFLNATELHNVETIGTIVVRYAGLTKSETELVQFTNIKAQGYYDFYHHFVFSARLKFSYLRANYSTSWEWVDMNRQGIVSKWILNPNNAYWNEMLVYNYANVDLCKDYRSGVLASTRNQLFLNGAKITTTEKRIQHVTQMQNAGMGNQNNQTLSPSKTGHWVIAAAYYKPTITSEQTHKDLYDRMMAI